MKKKIERPPDDKEQSRRFVETAEKLEADESGKAFERALTAVTLPSTSPIAPATVRSRDKSKSRS